MNSVVKAIKEKIFNNRKIFENYIFMTLLQVVSPLIGFIIYPYLIRVVGPSNYGLYVFFISIATYIVMLIAYGFSWIGLRDISCNQDNQKEKNRIVSTVLISKLLLFTIVTIGFYLLILIIPFFKENELILWFCFLQMAIPDLLFPVWFFQGLQKMKIVTFIQLFVRLLSIPLVFICIKEANDIPVYAMITSGCTILGALIAVWFVHCREKIRIYWVSYHEIKTYFKDGLSFFGTNIVGITKRELLPIITGSFLGMSELALYDLACKIIAIPNLLTDKINIAVFPEIIKNPIPSRIRKIMKMEIITGVGIILVIIALSYWIVLLMGGKQMILAYPLVCILSVTILSNLLSGNCMNLIFIPHKKYNYVFQLQIVSLVSVVVLCMPLLIWQSVFIVAVASALSGMSEVGYSFYRIKKQRLL